MLSTKTCLGTAALVAFYKADESRKMPFISSKNVYLYLFFLSFIRRFGHQYQDTNCKYDLNYIPVLSLAANIVFFVFFY